MTEGRLLGKIVIFILPLIASNLLQVAYNAADMMVVGLSSEKNAVGAIGTTGSFINLTLNILMGCAVGTNIFLARNIGAKNAEEASRTVHTSLCLALLLGFVSGAFGFSISRPLLRAIGTEDRLLDLASLYTRIYFLGLPFVSITNYCIAILRANGDTRTPLKVLSMTGVLNVLLNLFFVMVCHLSVEGVALATVAANAVSAVVLVLHLTRREGYCRLSFSKLKIHRKTLLAILRLGIPAGIHGALFSFSNLLIQSSVLQVNNAVTPDGATFEPVVAGNSACINLEGFISTAIDGVYQGALTFTGQNLGARKPERIKRVMLVCYLLIAGLTMLMSGGIYLLRRPLLALYGVVEGAPGTLDAIAWSTVMTRMKICTLLYFLLGLMNVGNGILRGLGYSLVSTIIGLLGTCAFRVVWLNTVFVKFPTLEIVYLSYPISWISTALVAFAVARVLLARIIRRTRLERAKEATPEASSSNAACGT